MKTIKEMENYIKANGNYSHDKCGGSDVYKLNRIKLITDAYYDFWDYPERYDRDDEDTDDMGVQHLDDYALECIEKHLYGKEN